MLDQIVIIKSMLKYLCNHKPVFKKIRHTYFICKYPDNIKIDASRVSNSINTKKTYVFNVLPYNNIWDGLHCTDKQLAIKSYTFKKL